MIDQILGWLVGHSPFYRANLPLSFAGDRLTYARALFSLMFTFAMCLMALLASMHNAWNDRHWTTWRDPLNVHRYILWLLLFSMMIAVGPDVAYLLAWNEVSAETLQRLLNLDRNFDALVFFPVSAAIYLWYRAKPVINYQLIRAPLPTDIWPNWKQLIPHMRVAALIAIISAGVALGK